MTCGSSLWAVVWVFGLLLDIIWVRYLSMVRVSLLVNVDNLVMMSFQAD